MDLAAGTLVDGKYRVVRPIGRGGMGAVYEVENVRIRKTVAMKLLSANAAEDVVKRFEKEAQAAGQIGSEHIVEVHDLGTMPTGEPYMVMELLEGETLRQRLHREKRLTAEASIPILVQVLEGLEAAHGAGIVHRDLKPENIYLVHQRGGLRDWVKILDFGISKFASVSEDGMTKTGQVIGTPQYMAPEQIKAPQTVDGRTDLYAVGVIFYQLLTGHIPFKAKTYAELLFKVVYEPLPHPTSFVPDLDREACDIVLTAMNREPAARFPNAASFRDRLIQLGARIGTTSSAEVDPMRAFLVASNAGLPRATAGDIPSPSPSRPGPPNFPGAGAASRTGGFGGGVPTPGFGPPGTGPHPIPHGSVPGSTPWPGSGTSWPGGAAQPSHPQPAFGPPGLPGADGNVHGAAPTQLFPAMGASSPSHPGLSASGLAHPGAPGFAQVASPNATSGVHGLPTPNPSFGGVPVTAATPSNPSQSGRKTAVLVASAVFAVGLGVTAFVATRPSVSSPASPSVESGASTSNAATSSPTAVAAPSPPAITAAPASTPATPAPSESATPPAADTSEPAPASSATPSSPRTPPAAPVKGPAKPAKPKNDFGY